MATEFKLPELGENIEAADVVSVLVKEGDAIKIDQAIIEIETDKATIEVPSSIEGKISKLLVKVGDKVKVGATILMIDEGVKTSDQVDKNEKTKSLDVNEEKPEVKSEPEVEHKASPSSKIIW